MTKWCFITWFDNSNQGTGVVPANNGDQLHIQISTFTHNLYTTVDLYTTVHFYIELYNPQSNQYLASVLLD